MTKNDKIRKALEKQAAEGSAYATERNMSQTMTPIQVSWTPSAPSREERMIASLDKINDTLKAMKKKDGEYFKVDNLIYPDFKRKPKAGEKRALLIDHNKGTVTTTIVKDE